MVENSRNWLDDPSYLLVEPCDSSGKKTASSFVALDLIGAKLGERVLISQGSSVRQTETTKDKPVDAIICGIIDQIVKEDKEVYTKWGES